MSKQGVIIFSPGCRLQCRFCSPPSPELVPRDLIENNLKSIYENIDFHLSDGVTDFEISGGDPCDGEIDDLLGIVKYLNKNNIKNILISTNGYSLNFDKIDALMSEGVRDFRIPLYGSTASIHNQIIGMREHAFNNAIESTKRILANNGKVRTQILITSINKHDIINALFNYIDLIEKHSPMGLSALTFFGVSIPTIADPITDATIESLSKYYIPLRHMKSVLIPIHNIIKQLDSEKIRIIEMPFCLVGEDTPFIINQKDFTYMSIGKQKPAKHLASRENDSIPNYRIQEHQEFCDLCALKDRCAGFYRNDIKIYGISQDDVQIIKGGE